MRQMKGLRIDKESGEGEVDLPEEFLQESALFRADVIQDWMYDLEKEYCAAMLEMRLHLITADEAMEYALQYNSDKAICLALNKLLQEELEKGESRQETLMTDDE